MTITVIIIIIIIIIIISIHSFKIFHHFCLFDIRQWHIENEYDHQHADVKIFSWKIVFSMILLHFHSQKVVAFIKIFYYYFPVFLIKSKKYCKIKNC